VSSLGPVEIGARGICDLVQALRGDVHGQGSDLAWRRSGRTSRGWSRRSSRC
jgi:hypothetical protein